MKSEIFKSQRFFIPKKYFFIPSKLFSYSEIFFHTFKMFFIPCIFFSYPFTNISYLKKNSFIPVKLFSSCAYFFIPFFQILYAPRKTVSYCLKKFHTFEFFFIPCISFHTKHKHFVLYAWYFIPSGQVSIPHATNFILISFSTHLIASMYIYLQLK
jgi:hypothetical protein